jgi:hypothetical protein
MPDITKLIKHESKKAWTWFKYLLEIIFTHGGDSFYIHYAALFFLFG